MNRIRRFLVSLNNRDKRLLTGKISKIKDRGTIGDFHCRGELRKACGVENLPKR